MTIAATGLTFNLPALPPEQGAPRRDRFFAEFGGVWSRIGDFQRTRMSWLGLAHLLRHARDVIDRGIPGDYAEFGTWRGGSLFAVARAWERISATDRALLGFDSFEGLPAPDDRHDGPWLRQGVFSDVDYSEIQRFFSEHGLNDRVTLIKGWFDRTIGRLQDHRVALLHIDADLYDSVKTALEAGWERLSPGGVVVFDDYRHPDCAGCTIAVEEFFAAHTEAIQTQPGTNYSGFVVKDDSPRTIVALPGEGPHTKWRPTICTETIARNEADSLRRRLLERCAAWCARSGFRHIALFGAGRHTRPITRQPWAAHGVSVTAIIDDEPRDAFIGGVPVFQSNEFTLNVDAVIVSSECYEDHLAARAHAICDQRGVPVIRIYGDEQPATNQADPPTPRLTPAKSEMRMRTYELAATFTRDARVLDIPCGDGAGSAILIGQGEAAAYTGIDPDARAILNARDRFNGPERDFHRGSLAESGLEASSIDAAIADLDQATDTVALIADLFRALSQEGVLVIHAAARESALDATSHRLASLLAPNFHIEQWLAQVEGDSPSWTGLPPGIFPLGEGPVPDRIIAIARRA
jgi:predicted O-methyltransferase YrrM